MTELSRCAEAVRADGEPRYLCSTLSGCARAELACDGIWLHAAPIEVDPTRALLLDPYPVVLFLAFTVGAVVLCVVIWCAHLRDKLRERRAARRFEPARSSAASR